MNNKGQFSFMTGLIVMVVALLMFNALFPVIMSSFGMSKGSDGANCKGYIDPDATALNNNSYDSTKNTDTLSCQIFGFGPGMIAISVIFGIIGGVISGKLGQREQESYQNYSYQ